MRIATGAERPRNDIVFTRGAMGGPMWASAPTDGYKGCNGRATARVAPTEMLVGADDPVRPMWVCNIFVGQGPCALPGVRYGIGGRPQGSPLRKSYKGCGEVRNPPVTASLCQPPLGKGAGDGRCGLPRARSALAMTEAERICVSFRDQSADWSWGANRALPVAEEARGASGRGQNFQRPP